MNPFSNPYNRLQEYISIFRNGQANLSQYDCSDEIADYALSMTELADITQIPLPVIRNDFCTIFEFQFSLAQKENEIIKKNTVHEINTKQYFEFSENHLPEDINDDPFCIFKVITRNSELPYQKLFLKYLCEEKFDSFPITLTSYKQDNYLIYLSTEEAQALNTYKYNNSTITLYQQFSETFENSYMIKDSFRYNKNTYKTMQLLKKLNQAVTNRQAVKAAYIKSPNNHMFFEFIPIKLIFDSTDNSYYVISIENKRINPLRLDRIISCEISPAKLRYPSNDELSLLEIAPQVWGCSFSDQPFHVKVKFKNVANVWKKVQDELQPRIKGTIFKKGDWLYYEDTVYGINKFRAWIFSYGRAAVVLEPVELRKQIVESLKERIEQYR